MTCAAVWPCTSSGRVTAPDPEPSAGACVAGACVAGACVAGACVAGACVAGVCVFGSASEPTPVSPVRVTGWSFLSAVISVSAASSVGTTPSPS